MKQHDNKRQKGRKEARKQEFIWSDEQQGRDEHYEDDN